jgi:hypothetical protein
MQSPEAGQAHVKVTKLRDEVEEVSGIPEAAIADPSSAIALQETAARICCGPAKIANADEKRPDSAELLTQSDDRVESMLGPRSSSP